MGEVYRADDLTLGTSVALKFLPVDVAGDPVRLERLRAEVRIARQVSHPNVCRVYDIAEAEGRPFLIMEHIDGGDLASLLRRIGRLPREKAVELARQVAAGVAAVHEHDILHRDLKPANIMIDGRGRARVADFGLAGALADFEGRSGLVAGTPAYMAPEQLKGREVTKSSDLYSLGLVMYELFTGKPALVAGSFAELRQLHDSSTRPPDPSQLVEDIDPAAERVILQCLEPEPADRPASALAVLTALPGGDPLAMMIQAGETPSPELVAASGRPGTLSRTAALSLVSLVVVGLFMVLWFFNRIPFDVMVGGVLPPQVLEHHAREILVDTGYEESAADSAWGFATDRIAIHRLRGRTADDRRALIRTEDRPIVHFWYRLSLDPMSPWRSSLPGFSAGDVVREDDPPMTEPGMAVVRLGPRGRLIELQTVPLRAGPSSSGMEPTQKLVSTVLKHAGVDPGSAKAVSPLVEPSAPGGVPRAWIANDATTAGIERRIDAVFSGSSLLWLSSTPNTAGEESRVGAGQRRDLASSIGTLLIFGFFSGGAVLAFVNRRAERWDRRGAMRLAVVVFVVCAGTVLLQAHHTFTPVEETRRMLSAVAYGAARGLMAWLLYVAMEPLIRRYRPTSLVSWSRLLAGRVTDPAVGRDVLVGLAVTIVQYLAMGVVLIPRGWAGAILSPGVFFSGARTLDWTIHLAQTLRAPVLSITFSLGYLMVYVLLRRLLGRASAVAPVVFALLIFLDRYAAMVTYYEPTERVLCSLIVAVGLTYAAVRCGLLAFITCMCLHSMVMYTIPTLDPRSWFFSQTVVLIAMTVGLAAFGARTSTTGATGVRP